MPDSLAIGVCLFKNLDKFIKSVTQGIQTALFLHLAPLRFDGENGKTPTGPLKIGVSLFQSEGVHYCLVSIEAQI